MEVLERPSVTDQLVGIRQDLVRLSRLALIAIIGVPVHFRLDGVDVVVGHLIEDFNEPRRGAPMALFRTNATRRLLVAATIRASSLMTGTPSCVPRDGGLKYVRRKSDGPAPSMSRSPVGIHRRNATATRVTAIIGRRAVLMRP